MGFTAEQDGFILMAHFRSGTQNADRSWSYSLQSCIQQFSERFPDFKFDYELFVHRRHVLLKRFQEKNCICKGKSTGRPPKVTKQIVADVANHMEESTNKSSNKLATQTENGNNTNTSDDEIDRIPSPKFEFVSVPSVEPRKSLVLNCPHCEKTFDKLCYLKVHMLRHTGEKLFQCEVCGERFTRISQIKLHLMTHIGKKHLKGHSDKKSFICELCDATFVYKHDLQMHILSHTGEKPY